MKVIICDIDGVLNNRNSMIAANQENPIHPPGPLGSVFTVDPECVARLRKVVEELDLKIVLSSTWRFHPTAFQTAMEWCGWENVPLIDRTARCAQNPLKGFERGSEISEWLDAHPQVTKYVIVDDSIKDIYQHDRLVRTPTDIGLTDEHCDQIRKLME